jgi:hypothetical protein
VAGGGQIDVERDQPRDSDPRENEGPSAIRAAASRPGAFIAIGLTWLLRGAGLDVSAAWLTAVAALAFGAAGLVTVLVRIAR